MAWHMWTALLAHIKSGRLAVKDVRVIEVKKSVFESNDERAALLRKDLKDKKETVEVQAPQKIKYQCLHTEEARECTCIRSKGLVLKK